MNSILINKYNVAGPRYTSYPTVPFWDQEKFSIEEYKKRLKDSFSESNLSEGISLYIHLPFCESLCTFCGCNKRITKRHEVESPYIAAVLAEWDLYLDFLKEKPRIKEIHLGGGTPTFFSPENLQLLINGIFRNAERAHGFDFSFEGHPNNTKKEHLKILFDLGFQRLSYGVQDYNAVVQQAINRFQPFVNVKNATDQARKIGYKSIGHDIIFGLPFQTLEHVKTTIEKTKELRGHILTEEDEKIRKHILNLMCKLKASWSDETYYFPELPQVLENLTEMHSDGLIEIQNEQLIIKEEGRPFLRNVCMAFDLLLERNQPESQLFSMTV